MSHIPVSAVIIYDGVVIDDFSMRFIGLYRSLCTCVSSAFVGIHVSAPYVSIGIRDVWTSCHIVAILTLLNSSFPAMQNIDWSAASTFHFTALRWASIFPFLFTVIPRYL